MKNYQKHFEKVSGSEFRGGNELTILQNGQEIFPAMLEAIRGAQSSIEFVTYVYWHSKVATQFADALCERARAGVTVRLLIDAIGGAIMSTRTVGQLEQAGVTVAWFRPLRFGHLRQINHRTHRKILIIDGRIGFTGGVGIADQWDGDGSGPGQWRETHCRIVGPACVDLAAGFQDNWLESTGENLPVPLAPAPAGSTAVLTTVSSYGSRPTPMERLFEAAIAAASERLWITTAYFVPTPELTQALKAATARGVDVRVLTNGTGTNHKFTLHAGRASYAELILAGVKMYEYQRTVLHVKIITVDRQWATTGSTNLDYRSLVLNDELNISMLDPAIIARLDSQFLEDIKASRHVRIAAWQRRGWPQRLLEVSSKAFSKQL